MTTTARATDLGPPQTANPSEALDAAYGEVVWRLLPFLMVLWSLA